MYVWKCIWEGLGVKNRFSVIGPKLLGTTWPWPPRNYKPGSDHRLDDSKCQEVIDCNVLIWVSPLFLTAVHWLFRPECWFLTACSRSCPCCRLSVASVLARFSSLCLMRSLSSCSLTVDMSRPVSSMYLVSAFSCSSCTTHSIDGGQWKICQVSFFIELLGCCVDIKWWLMHGFVCPCLQQSIWTTPH